MRTRVLIVGGPVGLTLAMDLAWRGIEVIVAECRPPNDPWNVKCGQIGARSMEIFRRLGLADKLRRIGLPANYPNDIVSATSVTDIELSRVPVPARGARYRTRRSGVPARLPDGAGAGRQPEIGGSFYSAGASADCALVIRKTITDASKQARPLARKASR
jgi:2-polyprenyl-6-methoxyphenol hydroxylase-like FAD-dependent oxidoreductase